MYTNLRQEIDGDFDNNFSNISQAKSDRKPFEIDCAVCACTFYTDQENYDRFCHTLGHGLDNPFTCTECQNEYEELAVERR